MEDIQELIVPFITLLLIIAAIKQNYSNYIERKCKEFPKTIYNFYGKSQAQIYSILELEATEILRLNPELELHSFSEPLFMIEKQAQYVIYMTKKIVKYINKTTITMKLQILDVNNRGSRTPKGGSTMTVNFKSGVISISEKAAHLIGVESGDMVKLAFDEDSSEYYIRKAVKDGFVCRQNTAKGHALLFNASFIAAKIAATADYYKPTGKMLIGTEAVEQDGVYYYPIILSSIK